MKSIALFTLIAAYTLSFTASAQPWMDNVQPSQKSNFYAIQKAFQEYWKDRDHKEKGKGWKAFKRWEWFWEQRLYPTGEFPGRMQLYDESKKIAGRRATHPGVFAANWTQIGPSDSPGGYAGLGRLNCVRTAPGNPDIIWVGSASGGVWKSTDGGSSWSTNTDELPSLGVTDIVFHPTDPDIMYLATGDGDAGDDYSVGVLKSTDAGTTWNTTGLNWTTSQTTVLSRLLIDPVNPAVMLAAGNGMFRTTDGGDTWTQVSAARIHDMEFKPGDPSVVYASGANSDAYRSTDNGSTWNSMTNGFPGGGRRIALGVTPANPSYVYALIANAASGFYGMYRSTNGGDSWSVRSTSPNLLGWDPNGADAGGQGWYDLTVAVSPSDGEELYTGGVNNWKSTNGGQTWTISSMWYYIPGIAEVHADQHDLYFAPGTTTLFVGNDGGIYRTTDHGDSWQWLGTGLRTTQFYRFGTSQTDPDRLIGGTQDNGTKMSNDDNWSDVLGGDGMEALVDYSNANIMYGELYYGDIYRSMNGGASWTPIAGGIPESGGWVTPYIIHPTDPATLFAGFQHVWKTTNRGASWISVTNFGGNTLDLMAISPSNPNVIYAGNGSLIYRTTNGGSTNWAPISRPAGAGYITYMAVHSTDPDHIWVTSSGFTAGQKVYESTDGGTTWTNISGNLPNVPTNCVIYQNDSPDRIYVGTDIGVFYKDLTTPEWQDFNTGLANVTVTELEIQYATGKIRAATYGRGIWESDFVTSEGAVIGVSQASIDFGRIEVGFSGDTTRVDITNYGTGDTLVITAIGLSGTDFAILSAPAVPLELAPLETATLEVTFVPPSAGNALDSILIVSNAVNGSTMTIPLSGRGVVIGQAEPLVMYTANGSLSTVDLASGTVTLIGTSGLTELQSLTVHPVSKELYGALSTTTNMTVYRVSSSSGDALPLATFDTPYLRAIAFDENADLYGMVAFGAGSGDLYRLDLATGTATLLGSASSVTISSLVFSPATGRLWASDRPPVGTKDRIYTVSLADGAATLVGQTGFPTRITAAIAFDQQGRLFGITGSGTQTNEFIEIDTATATGTLIGSMGTTNLTALAMRVDSLLTDVRGQQTSSIPARYSLEQNYPNPFNPVTEISYGLPTESDVTLTVFNMLGQEVAVLHSGSQRAGVYRVFWNGTNTTGASVASGLYFYKLQAAGSDGNKFVAVKKMLYLK